MFNLNGDNSLADNLFLSTWNDCRFSRKKQKFEVKNLILSIGRHRVFTGLTV